MRVPDARSWSYRAVWSAWVQTRAWLSKAAASEWPVPRLHQGTRPRLFSRVVDVDRRVLCHDAAGFCERSFVEDPVAFVRGGVS